MYSATRGLTLAATLVLSTSALAQQPQDPPPAQERIRALEQRVFELEQGRTTPESSASTAPDGPSLLNPEITVFVDFVGSLSTDGDNEALNRFSLREAELHLGAPITPWARAALVLTAHEEIEEMPGGDIDIETVLNMEEGYLTFHDFGLGHTSLKAGKFRNTFGSHNKLHTHAIPQVTRPLANQAFFGAEGLATTGVAFGLASHPSWADELGLNLEIINADGGEEAPILGGPDAENPAAIARVALLSDVGDSSTIELGGSYLYTRTSGDADFDAHVFGGDFAYHLHDPESDEPHDLAVARAEVFWASNDVADPGGNFRNESLGAYASAEVAVCHETSVGLRGDFTEFPDSETRGPNDSDWAFSPYVSWWPADQVRLRFEYQHRSIETSTGTREEDAFFLNLTFSFGAHAKGTHPGHPHP